MARGARRNNYKITIDGAKELGKALEGMGDDAAELVAKATEAGGEIALRDAKARAPVDTGRLQRNIVMSRVKKRAGKAGTKKRTLSAAVTIGFSGSKKGSEDDAYYGPFVELGTKYQSARFFIRDAVDKNKAAISAAIVDAFKKLGR